MAHLDITTTAGQAWIAEHAQDYIGAPEEAAECVLHDLTIRCGCGCGMRFTEEADFDRDIRADHGEWIALGHRLSAGDAPSRFGAREYGLGGAF